MITQGYIWDWWSSGGRGLQMIGTYSQLVQMAQRFEKNGSVYKMWLQIDMSCRNACAIRSASNSTIADATWQGFASSAPMKEG